MTDEIKPKNACLIISLLKFSFLVLQHNFVLRLSIIIFYVPIKLTYIIIRHVDVTLKPQIELLLLKTVNQFYS